MGAIAAGRSEVFKRGRTVTGVYIEVKVCCTSGTGGLVSDTLCAGEGAWLANRRNHDKSRVTDTAGVLEGAVSRADA